MCSTTVAMRIIRCCSIGVVAFLLASCGASQYAPVQELGYSNAQLIAGNSVQSAPTSYQVRPGDTMFAIAWRFGWDYKKLAKANAIGSPYTIYVGQKIYFNDTSRNTLIGATAVERSVKKPDVSSKSTIRKTLPSTSKTTAKATVAKGYKGPSSIKWSWPLRGKLIQGFSNKDRAFQGIDVASTLGKPVKAASSGIIVYAGSGIQGYGKLVVVKHNGTFLSAYAYNSRILVAEGAKVNAGQVIAEVGKGPQLDPRLHFEIRKDGKPVNPLRYLPKL
ncbi:MAG: lipoprotein NlpD [Oceanospirillaceae bacterium]|jgi:lipoprotein NlpD